MLKIFKPLQYKQELVNVMEWISVKDKKPQFNTAVLAVAEWFESKNRVYLILKMVKEDDCMWRTSDDNSEISYSLNVTHWMPLPKPPNS